MEHAAARDNSAAYADALIAALPHDAVLVLDEELHVLHATGRGLKVLGVDPSEQQLPPDVAELLVSAVSAVLVGASEDRDVWIAGRLWRQELTLVELPGPRQPAVMVLWQDVTESRAAHARLKESELQLRLTVENAPIGEALVELDGRWRWVNAALAQLTGYTEAELLRTTFQEITHPDDLASDLQLLHQLVAGEIDSYQMEKRYFTASGSTVWVLLCVALVRSDQGDPLYFVSQIVDITDRKMQEAALRDLTSMLAHDLRTPTTVIAGYAELLLNDDEPLTASGRRGVVTRLARAAATLEDLLDNSLTASALDAQGLMPAPEAVDLGLVVREVVGAIPHPGVSIDLSGVGSTVGWFDRQHLHRVLSNVVSNAVKYGGGEVLIEIEERDGMAGISVADRGEGVPGDFVPRLFDRFTRADATRSSRQRGSGLGLHIVRDLMLLNGGTAAYVPTPGGGATFLLDLPMPASG